MDVVWFAFIVVIYHKSVHGNIYFLDPEVMKFLLNVVNDNFSSKESDYDENYTQTTPMDYTQQILRSWPTKPTKIHTQHTTKSIKSQKDVHYNKFVERHNERIATVNNFILGSNAVIREQTIKFLYGEMQRILKYRVLMDDVTSMVVYLSGYKRVDAKQKFVKCFFELLPKNIKSFFDSETPNNLIIKYT